MAETRTEKDSLGTLEVPADALYGVQTARAVDNFPISGLRPLPIFITSYVMIKKAAALVHEELDMLDAEKSEAIVAAADEVLEGKHHDQFVVDVYQAGAGTSHNMNTNEVLANRAIEILGGERGDYSLVHPNDHVNMGQSTNDTIPAGIRIAACRQLLELRPAVDALADAFDEKGKAAAHVVKSARTHLQDAMPIGMGQVLSGFANTLRKARGDLDRAYERLCESNLGGTACGTGINTHPEYRAKAIAHIAEWTGAELRPADDMVEIMQSMGDIAFASGCLRRLAVDLIKIANDLRLLSSGPKTGLMELTLPAVQPGSSIMPGKVNPVIAECADQVMLQVIGLDATIAAAAQHGNLDLNVMMPVIGWNLTLALHISTTTCEMLRKKLVDGLEVNAERCAEYLERSVGTAAILNSLIGYEKAGEVAKEAEKTGRTIKEVALDKGYVTAEQWKTIFSPEKVIRPGVPSRWLD